MVGTQEMKKLFKLSVYCLAACILFGMTGTAAAAKTENKDVVVMIDPGHGGSNLGGQYGNYTEKYMTMITALAMKEELEKYEGITVHLSHTEDVDMSLAARAQAAQDIAADYLFSLHYNMSAEHLFFGSEVWIPSVGTNYAKGYALGDLILSEFMDKGAYNRGIKTKLNKNGLDYYGVIRECTARGIPSVLIEHCHLDHLADMDFYDAVEDMQSFGRDDATAVAKYFGLSSKTLGVDYSNIAKTEIPAPAVAVGQDLTPPEIAAVTIDKKDTKKNLLSMTLTGHDSDSGLLYYSYSTDGGIHWSGLQIMPVGKDTVSITVPYYQSAAVDQAVIRVYNGYDGMTQSAGVFF